MQLIMEFNNGDHDFANNAIPPVLRESILNINNEENNRVPLPARSDANSNWTSNERTAPARIIIGIILSSLIINTSSTCSLTICVCCG